MYSTYILYIQCTEDAVSFWEECWNELWSLDGDFNGTFVL